MGWLDAAIPVVSSVGAYYGQREANEANAAIAASNNAYSNAMSQDQMKFQERMSSTAHQREVEDLRKAGLNPILSANKGGASTPAGSMGQTTTAHMESALGKGIGSAMEALSLNKELQAKDATIQLSKAQKMAQEASANRDNTTAKATAVNTKIAEMLAPGQILQSQAAGSQSKNYMDNKTFYDSTKMIGEGLGLVNSAKDAISLPSFTAPKMPTKKPQQSYEER